MAAIRSNLGRGTIVLIATVGLGALVAGPAGATFAGPFNVRRSGSALDPA